MEIENWQAATLDDPASILAMPLPENASLDQASHEQLREVCRISFRLWKELLIDEAAISLRQYELKSPSNGTTVVLEGDEVWDYLFLLIASYYDHAFMRLVSFEREGGKGTPPGISLETLRSFIKGVKDLAPKMIALRFLSHHYFGSLLTLYFVDLFKSLPIDFPPHLEFESQFHMHIEDLFELLDSLRAKYVRILGFHLLGRVLSYSRSVYEKAALYNIRHMPGPFSAIRLQELGLLAGRDEGLIRRYGETRVAKVFENQLALIAQSFGLYVVSTRAGEKTVDLVCISSNPDHPITFIVEAKTSRRAYFLPKSDARALREYASDISASLTTLPPLTFIIIIIIIGPDPASTLPKKLIELEAQVGVPVRYLKAQQLADLREGLPGPLPIRIFSRHVLTSPAVLPQSFVPNVIQAYQKEQEAHSQFVKAMLDAKGAL